MPAYCNLHAERFVRSIKEERLNRTILFGRHSLEGALREYGRHYHGERNHQALGNKLIDSEPDDSGGPTVERRERLGGLLRQYFRAGARADTVRVLLPQILRGQLGDFFSELIVAYTGVYGLRETDPKRRFLSGVFQMNNMT